MTELAVSFTLHFHFSRNVKKVLPDVALNPLELLHVPAAEAVQLVFLPVFVHVCLHHHVSQITELILIQLLGSIEGTPTSH